MWVIVAGVRTDPLPPEQPHGSRTRTSWRMTSVLLVQGGIALLLLIGWLLMRDPTFAVAYPLACADPGVAAADGCTVTTTQPREYYRLRPERQEVVAWEDRPFARAEKLTRCRIIDTGDWECPGRDGRTRFGLRDGLGFREVDGQPDPGRRYVGATAWWWAWLGEWARDEDPTG